MPHPNIGLSPKKIVTQSGARSGRKRPRPHSDCGPVSKPRIDSDIALSPQFRRVSSPGKNVHFPHDLIQGPTVSDPARRSESPSRSALREHADDIRGAEHKSGITKDLPNCKVKDGAGSTDDQNIDMCTSINDMKRDIMSFAQEFPEPNPYADQDVFDSLLQHSNEHLIRYIGSLAMGGLSGVEGWRALLQDKTCRQGLICGIVSWALKEAVFGALYFGAPMPTQEYLVKQEKELVQKDGFHRTEKRADYIKACENGGFGKQAMVDTIRIALQLEKMLLPFWELGNRSDEWDISMRNTLISIVKKAAGLSRNMRKDEDTVYYWPPTFKDEEFDPSRMECFNLESMIRNSPYDKKKVNGADRAILREGCDQKSEATVRVVCFPGLVEYRQGGGELAKRELAQEKRLADLARSNTQRQKRKIPARNERGTFTGEEGFRTTVVSKGGVILQWGKQRLLTKEAGTSAHLDAMRSGLLDKYEKNRKGFVELYDYFQETVL